MALACTCIAASAVGWLCPTPGVPSALVSVVSMVVVNPFVPHSWGNMKKRRGALPPCTPCTRRTPLPQWERMKERLGCPETPGPLDPDCTCLVTAAQARIQSVPSERHALSWPRNPIIGHDRACPSDRVSAGPAVVANPPILASGHGRNSYRSRTANDADVP